MSKQECTPTTAEIRDDYVLLNTHNFDAYLVGHSLGEERMRHHEAFDRWLATHDAEVRADERAKLQDRIEELEKNLSYEVEQKIKLADTLRDERAKRPDREQVDRIQFEIDNVHQIHGDTCLCGFKSSRSRSRTEHLTALFAEAVLALEPEARTRTEWGVAYRQGDGSLFVDEAVNREDAESRIGWEGATYDFVVSRQVTDYRPVGDEPEAREEAEYFRDGDGDLWKFTDKGEWFHEEEPGEFRQVLSIDAEDQTLTPVGHAELAPAPEAREEPKHGLIEDYAAVQAPDWAKVNAKLDALDRAMQLNEQEEKR